MASKGTIQLQLQIDTTFKNIKSEVDSLNQALKGIKFDNKAFGCRQCKKLDSRNKKYFVVYY